MKTLHNKFSLQEEIEKKNAIYVDYNDLINDDSMLYLLSFFLRIIDSSTVASDI